MATPPPRLSGVHGAATDRLTVEPRLRRRHANIRGPRSVSLTLQGMRDRRRRPPDAPGRRDAVPIQSRRDRVQRRTRGKKRAHANHRVIRHRRLITALPSSSSARRFRQGHRLPSQVGLRFGSAPQIALRRRTSHRHEKTRLRRALDAFRYCADTDRPREPDDALDNRRIILALIEPIDERAVDLHFADRKLAQLQQ